MGRLNLQKNAVDYIEIIGLLRIDQDKYMPCKRPINTYALMILILAGCSQDRGDVGLRNQCSAGLDAGYRELNRAEADGFSGALTWSKAASLLSVAKVQEQFEEYQNCVLKVQKARRYLREIRN
jgi:hypothetical protein